MLHHRGYKFLMTSQFWRPLRVWIVVDIILFKFNCRKYTSQWRTTRIPKLFSSYTTWKIWNLSSKKTGISKHWKNAGLQTKSKWSPRIKDGRSKKNWQCDFSICRIHTSCSSPYARYETKGFLWFSKQRTTFVKRITTVLFGWKMASISIYNNK